MATGGHLKKKHLQKKLSERFEQCSSRLLAEYNFQDINSLLVNIYTDRYVGNEGIYIVFAL